MLTFLRINTTNSLQHMHVSTIYKLISLLVLWLGCFLLTRGVQNMFDANYRAPEMPAGWLLGICWISLGGIIAVSWFIYMTANIIDQKISNKPRWTCLRTSISLFPLLSAACMAICGTFIVWQHPYVFPVCECSDAEWGPLCLPCECDRGVCDSGSYGSGRCACDIGWGGPRCDVCGDRWKGDECDICKTGYTNAPFCDRCDRGYDGDECDICANGWQPWQHSSALFPNTISEDDHRHLCDECIPNHFGYYCKPCPTGNDVPHTSIEKNDRIIKGTRVSDASNLPAEIIDMQVYKDDQWTKTFDYDVNNPKALTQVRIKIKYDYTGRISDWIDLGNIRGIQCNNRGTCEDDQLHQQKFPEWQDTCTYTSFQECSSDSDCTVSENCKGECRGTLPIPALWAIRMPEGKLCSSDDDCNDPNIILDEFGTTYDGGRCVSRKCCDESRHGSGTCDCKADFFGRKEPDAIFDQSKLSPACDFCPGYDWISDRQSSICSGGKGTCTPGYSRDGDYLNMRCTCGHTAYIDPITKIVDTTRKIAWSGPLCECGDWNNDQKCDKCASGHWGPNCKICPGGFGMRACSGHGVCDGSGSNSGTGRCDCDVKTESAWMLAPAVRRFPSETLGTDIDGNTDTCIECAPNYWGEKCQQCSGFTGAIKPSELSSIFQPIGSISFGIGQSSLEPQPLCHPQKPWLCTLACNGGGWCNWGRSGTNTCTCWSNKRLNENTWNPMDNVCIGNDRFVGDDYKGYGEVCPSFGYCSENRDTLCGLETFIGNNKDMSVPGVGWTPADDWSHSAEHYSSECSGQCYGWQKINWRPKISGNTCELDN